MQGASRGGGCAHTHVHNMETTDGLVDGWIYKALYLFFLFIYFFINFFY